MEVWLPASFLPGRLRNRNALKAPEGKLSSKIKLKNPVMEYMVILPWGEHSKPSVSARSKERLPGSKILGHACLYTSNHTKSTEASSTSLFFHKISPPGPAEASYNISFFLLFFFLCLQNPEEGLWVPTTSNWGVGT